MIADIQARVEQLSPSVLQDGDQEIPRLSNIGQLFTADWHQRLIMAGRAYKMTIGTITGSNAHALVGNGTTVDLDLPHGVVAVDSGILIPMSLNLSALSNAEADGNVVEVLLTTDRATAVPASELAGVSTAEIPANLLDGGEAFEGRAASIITTEITDPVHTDLLFYKGWETIEAGVGVTFLNVDFSVDEDFPLPTLLRGPCSLHLNVGGSAAVTFMASLTFAHIPSDWVPVS